MAPTPQRPRPADEKPAVFEQALAGGDPYDALRGSRVPRWLTRSARGRQMIVQLRKRVPIDIGPLLGIQPFVMAKTVGCFLAAEARWFAAMSPESADVAAKPFVGAGVGEPGGVPTRLRDTSTPSARTERVATSPERALDHRRAARDLVSLLETTRGNLGDGAWGYEFDVQTRWGFYPAGEPNLIATAFVGRGFLESGVAMGDPAWRERGVTAARFVIDRLHRRDSSGRSWLRYTLASDRLIHNANLLGSALVAAAGATAARSPWLGTALETARASLEAQRPDGSWPYGEGAGLEWCDNFHTAYDLDGLLLVWLATRDAGVLRALRRGADHWARVFFGPRGEPGYLSDRPRPFDIHCAATAVDVAARLAGWGFPTADLARRIAGWTAEHLIDPGTGRTRYQKRLGFTDKRHFPRWGDAHWALARSSLALLDAGVRPPLEETIAGESGAGPVDAG